MRMPDSIDVSMLAPCGMNCMVCYRHLVTGRKKQACQGCLSTDGARPAHCRDCRIKKCAQSRGLVRCLQCAEFPCGLLKNLERSYNKRYSESLLANSREARDRGIDLFLELDRKRRTCACGGAISLHDAQCSECGKTS